MISLPGAISTLNDTLYFAYKRKAGGFPLSARPFRQTTFPDINYRSMPRILHKPAYHY